jgi:hypothetical protein
MIDSHMADHPTFEKDVIDDATRRLQVKINRLQSQKAALENQAKKAQTTNRKARTRTLIQLGSLLNLINLPSICGIKDGDDLQFDLEATDKAATLLGMLAHLEDSLPPALSPAQLEALKQKGVTLLKQSGVTKGRAGK